MRSTLLVLIGLTFSLASHADNLLSLYQRALLASPELSGSQYALDIVRAQEDQAFGKLLPQAALRGNYSGNQLKYETRSGVGYPGRNAGLNIRQPLFDLQAYLLMKSQEALTAKGEENLISAHQQLIFDLVDRYVDALEATDKTEIIDTELKSTEKQLARVKSMSERQMALITDLYQLQAKVETLRSDLIVSQNDAHIALEKLRELTGDAITNVQPVRLDTQQPPPDGTVDSWVEQISRNNPDISALKHAVESADQSISAYQAGHLPRLELQAGANYSDTSFNNQQSPPYHVGTVGVEATIPLYEGGITSARVREAEGRKGLGNSQLEQKQREIEKITRNAFLDMSISQARSQATDRALEASIKSKLAMEKGYELGVVTIIDLLNAQKLMSEAQKNQRQARYRYFKTRTALLQQAGRLDIEELAKLNDWLIADTTLAKTAEPVSDVDNTKTPPKPAPNAVTQPGIQFADTAKPVATPKFVAPVANTQIKPVAPQAVATPKVETPAANIEIKPVDNSAAEADTSNNIELDNKTAERAEVNEKVQKFVHADFKPVIKSVTNPYKSANKNSKPAPKP